MKSRLTAWRLPALGALAAFALTQTLPAQATEGGGSVYPVGVTGFSCCALPPPGTYMMLDAQSYSAGEVKDEHGNNVPIQGFKVRATALATRFIWVTPQQLWGGSLALHAIVPLVNLSVAAGGAAQTKTGIGDITFGPAIGWHLSPQLHTVAAIDFFAPTGAYRRGDLANIGRNHWAMHLVGGISYVQPTGLNADAKMVYAINARNKATDYRDGDEFIVDYAAGWALGNGWTLGAGGYVYRQLSDDTQADVTVADNRGRAFAIGPSIRYDSGQGWFLTLKAYHESGVRNRADGSSVWLRGVFPL
ncbi:MAG: transporter [Proteobacteria bacterium]|nr:transporter [Pseudomonadota bacterium]